MSLTELKDLILLYCYVIEVPTDLKLSIYIFIKKFLLVN